MTTQQKKTQNKLGILRLAQHLDKVSKACKIKCYPRDGFYRYKELYEQEGELALQEISRKKLIDKNRVEEALEKAVESIAIEKPTLGQLPVNELRKEGSWSISPSRETSTWLRYDQHTIKIALRL